MVQHADPFFWSVTTAIPALLPSTTATGWVEADAAADEDSAAFEPLFKEAVSLGAELRASEIAAEAFADSFGWMDVMLLNAGVLYVLKTIWFEGQTKRRG